MQPSRNTRKTNCLPRIYADERGLRTALALRVAWQRSNVEILVHGPKTMIICLKPKLAPSEDHPYS
jgi:hypothetical protein